MRAENHKTPGLCTACLLGTCSVEYFLIMALYHQIHEIIQTQKQVLTNISDVRILEQEMDNCENKLFSVRPNKKVCVFPVTCPKKFG